MKEYYYGVYNEAHLIGCIKKAVHVFGGGNKAIKLLAGTACAETDFATFPDVHPEKLGVGVTQFDQIGFDDVIKRTRPKNVRKFHANYNYDWSTLTLDKLAYDPELALAITRLKYMLVPESLPTTVEGMAKYWKRYYNTYAANAKGTPEKFLEDFRAHCPKSLSI